MDFQTFIYFLALFYLGVISIETTMIVYEKDSTMFEAVIRTSEDIIKYITIKSNKSNKDV